MHFSGVNKEIDPQNPYITIYKTRPSVGGDDLAVLLYKEWARDI